MRDRARRCTAKSKRSGKRCRANVYRKPDGSYTRTCRAHSGGHELRDPGDERNGGRPPTTYIDVRLTPELWRDFHESARAAVGKLDEELALLRTNLARFKFSEATKPTVSEAERGRIEREHVDGIARVEERRARILTLLQNLDSPPDPIRVVMGDEPEDPGVTDDARERLRDRLLRDE